MGVPPTHFSLRSGLSARIFSVLQKNKDLAGAATRCGAPLHQGGEDLQRRGHVAGGDAVDPDAGIGPLNG